MLKHLSFKTKIFFLVTSVVTVAFLALTLIVSNRTIQLAKNDAFDLAEEIADKYKLGIKSELQDARENAEIIADFLKIMKDRDITDRGTINKIIKSTLAREEYITSFSIAYEPNALDGRDSEFHNYKQKYDGTGRFASHWYKMADNIEVEPLSNIDAAGWYKIPKMTKQEYIPDPYPSLLQGREAMMISFVFPIIHQDEFIGVISSDIVLDKLQEMVSGVNTRRNGEFTTIYTNSGAVVAHPEKEFLKKDIEEVRVHHANEAKNAIGRGESYVSSCNMYYTVYMPVQISAAADPWSVAVSFPMDEILKPARNIWNYIIITSIISICAIIIILFFILKNITRPILTLANTAKNIGEGNFRADISANQGKDEIGVLFSAIKLMAEKLIAAKEQAEKSSRAKGDFLSNMSHEMRTPLNAIIGMTTIGKSALDTGKKDYAFEKIEDASTHLLGVINDVLDMAKIEANKMELSVTEFAFEKIINRVVNVINFRVEEKQQSLHISIDENIPKKVIGDDLRLSQIITNLLSNAVKFTPEGGSIQMKAALLEEKNGIYTIRFEVIDSGIGISPEQQARLFSSFQQADSSTSRKFGGTGLGLVISKRFIELMGGEIHIKSEPGKGAAFIFTIKVERGKEERTSGHYGNRDNIQILTADDDCPDLPATFPGRRVLVAEDVEINREIVLALFEPMELETDCVENGKEALRLFSENPDRYDMIFMDIQMPEMDGFEATRRIRALEQENSMKVIPIIAMSANVFRQDIEKCQQAGMNDHVGKPLDMEVITGKLRKYLPATAGSGCTRSAGRSSGSEETDYLPPGVRTASWKRFQRRHILWYNNHRSDIIFSCNGGK